MSNSTTTFVLPIFHLKENTHAHIYPFHFNKDTFQTKQDTFQTFKSVENKVSYLRWKASDLVWKVSLKSGNGTDSQHTFFLAKQQEKGTINIQSNNELDDATPIITPVQYESTTRVHFPRWQDEEATRSRPKLAHLCPSPRRFASQSLSSQYTSHIRSVRRRCCIKGTDRLRHRCTKQWCARVGILPAP
jgi:hypothetical protein